MQLIRQNDPASMGAIIGRPDICLPTMGTAQNPDIPTFACALHAQGTDSLRVALFRENGNANIERIALGPETGDIEGSTAMTVTRDWLLTATHGEGSNRLRVVSWRIAGNSIERKGDSGTQIGTPGGTADLAYIGGTKTALAVKDDNGDLKVIVLRANGSSGAISRHDGDAAGGIHENPSIAFVGPMNQPNGPGLPTPAEPGPAFVVTAVQASNNRIKLICWEVDGTNVGRRGDTGNGGAQITGRPAIVGWPNHDLAVCAYRRANGRLELRSFKIDGNGGLNARDTHTLQAGAFAHSPALAFGLGDAGGPDAATAVVLRDGRLRVDDWSISEDGEISHRDSGTSDVQATGSPSISPAVIGTDAGIPRGYFVAVRVAGSNQLSLSKWA